MAQDHTFKVIDARNGAVLMQTESFREACDMQTSTNAEQRTTEIKLWIFDRDGIGCRITTQLL